MPPAARPLIFGEVLFDCFPDGSRVLGGAPFNTAWHLQGLGEPPCFISRVGNDDAGRAVLGAMRKWHMDTQGMQIDPTRPTGRVDVTLSNGEPSYRIQPGQAYGHIAPSAATSGQRASLVYHGSLALCHGPSRVALTQLIRATQAPVFLDVNLRPPWWSKDEVLAWMNRATWLKLNEAELHQLAPDGATTHQQAWDLVQRHRLRLAVVTRGAAGAFSMDADGVSHNVAPRGEVSITDTVGAGDAFAAVLMFGLMRDWPLPVTLARAQQFASAVVGVRGATTADLAFYRNMLTDWGPDP